MRNFKFLNLVKQDEGKSEICKMQYAKKILKNVRKEK
jgi:hypothetical protein